MSSSRDTVFVTGAAGFIGSQLVDQLLARGNRVIGIDNFVRGTRENIRAATGHPLFRLIEADLSSTDAVVHTVLPALEGEQISTLWHMAANSDIPAGIADPQVDLRDTFMTTFQSLKLVKKLGIRRFAFASTSAVYGEHTGALREDTGPLLPISNYGAMKLASEAALSACHDLERLWIFRFPNVIGPRGTHGVIYDLLHKLQRNPDELEVLGDGTQQKPYLHVSELLDAMHHVVEHGQEKVNLYNIGPEDEGATVHDIANAVLAVRGHRGTRIRYTGGNRGWVGDVPRFFYSVTKLAALGWRPTHGSTDAVRRAVAELAAEIPA